MLLGALLIGLYVLSDMAQSPSCGFLAWGGLALVVGIILWFRDPVKPPDTERFRVLRGANKKQGEKK